MRNGLLIQHLKTGYQQASVHASFPVAYRSFCVATGNILAAVAGSSLALNHDLTSVWFVKQGSEWPLYVEIFVIGF